MTLHPLHDCFTCSALKAISRRKAFSSMVLVLVSPSASTMACKSSSGSNATQLSSPTLACSIAQAAPISSWSMTPSPACNDKWHRNICNDGGTECAMTDGYEDGTVAARSQP